MTEFTFLSELIILTYGIIMNILKEALIAVLRGG